jgi:hypothetical protein
MQAPAVDASAVPAEGAATPLPRSASGELDAFISYSHRDGAYVARLVAALEALGRNVWIDTDDIAPGTEWRKELGTRDRGGRRVRLRAQPGRDHLVRVWRRAPSRRRDPQAARGRRAPGSAAAAARARRHRVDSRRARRRRADHGRDLPRDHSDHDQVRAHTKWLSRALRWEEHGRKRSRLLRGRELEDADRWLTSAQRRDPAATPIHTGVHRGGKAWPP